MTNLEQPTRVLIGITFEGVGKFKMNRNILENVLLNSFVVLTVLIMWESKLTRALVLASPF